MIGDGQLKRLKNVSIQELKKDLEKSRQQQREKLARQQQKTPAANGVIINGDSTIIDMDSKQPQPQQQQQRSTRLSQKKLPVEKLDITAALDVSSIVSSPSPQPPPPPPPQKLPPPVSSSISPLPGDHQTIMKQAKIPKPISKRSQGSIGGIKLTELEMAKLGRLGIAGGQFDGTGKGKTTIGRKSPLPSGKQPQTTTPSPKPPGRSPRPSPRESPIPGKKDGITGLDDGVIGDVDKKAAARIPRSEMPTRKERMQQRKEAAAAAAATDGKKPTEMDAKQQQQPATKEHGSKSSSSSSRSRSRERGVGRKLSREMSKDVQGSKGSRKQSLLDQSPSSRAAKNINEYGHKLVALCRKGDWVGVDTIIKYLNKYNVEFDKMAVSETTGWSPLMFAVRDNRIQISEQLIDLGIPINTKAKVSETRIDKIKILVAVMFPFKIKRNS
ncbi:hypothetical protein BLA29_003703 [Euroglyphus maynei]|uniref:Uncharacterized protein n=1 Tax=Euroglyphus maynei TaxID=6958 RepID=A0A1Y3ALU6_EURMA|nr:hypothetical protein BLA29_003703 [Euroglyphus maynei]